MGEAGFAEGVATQVGFGAGGLKLRFAGSDCGAQFGDLAVLCGEGHLGAVASLQCFRLRILDFSKLALFAGNTVVRGGEGLASGALVGLGHGKFLGGELRGVAGGRDVEFVGVHCGLDAEGLLVERR